MRVNCNVKKVFLVANPLYYSCLYHKLKHYRTAHVEDFLKKSILLYYFFTPKLNVNRRYQISTAVEEASEILNVIE